MRATIRLLSGRFAKNTASMSLGLASRVALQGIYFIIIARALGVGGFGAFAATLALAMLVMPFGSLGAVNLMIRHIVRDQESAAKQFSTAACVTVIGGTLFTLGLTFTSPLFAPSSVSPRIVFLVATAELLSARLVEVAGAAYSATERMLPGAIFQIWFNSARLLGALTLALSPLAFTLSTWSMAYAASSAIASLLVMIVVMRALGLTSPDLRQFTREWREGSLFAISLSSQTIYNDIDKAMLARMSSLGATGTYTAAYRVIDMSFTPVRALLGAAYPRFFRHGSHGLGATLLFTRRLALPSGAYALAMALALLLGADLVPLILGADYNAVPDVLHWLSVLPILKVAHYLAADTLTGSGHQASRSIAQVMVAAFNAALNFALIPAYGFWGAVAASLISDLLLAVGLWSIIGTRLRIERRAVLHKTTV